MGSDNLDSFDGVGARMRIAPLALSFSLLALGGFPPLSGFWSKLAVFLSAIQSPYNLGWLAVVGIINSFVSIAFYLRIVKHMYVDEPPSLGKAIRIQQLQGGVNYRDYLDNPTRRVSVSIHSICKRYSKLFPSRLTLESSPHSELC